MLRAHVPVRIAGNFDLVKSLLKYLFFPTDYQTSFFFSISPPILSGSEPSAQILRKMIPIHIYGNKYLYLVRI